MPKVEIHLEISVPSQRLDVNQIIALFQEVLSQLGPELAALYLEATQDQMLEQVLGPKWADRPQEATPWACPQCGSQQGFSRRGSRPRVLRKTSLGRVPFQLRQVTCDRCEGTFSPFTDWLDLKPYQVSTTEFQAKAARVACQTSYARSVEHIRELGGIDVSATAVHQWVQSRGAQVTLDDAQADDRPVLLDSTRVRAGRNQRGCNLNLGISIEKRCWTGGRPRLKIHPVCFGVNQTWSQTGQALAARNPARLVYDGDEDVTHWVERTFPGVPKQRCVWHLIHQLYPKLWQDGLNKAQAKVWMKALGKAIYDPKAQVQESRIAVQNLIRQMWEHQQFHGSRYLEGAQPYIFTYREQPDGMFFDEWRWERLAISSISPIERQMREINRRTDVGARWSITGVQNLVALDLVRRFDQVQWQTLWNLPQHHTGDFSVVNLHMPVTVDPPPNVKTT